MIFHDFRPADTWKSPANVAYVPGMDSKLICGVPTGSGRLASRARPRDSSVLAWCSRMSSGITDRRDLQGGVETDQNQDFEISRTIFSKINFLSTKNQTNKNSLGQILAIR